MTKSSSLSVIILAAGKGTRMKSDLPKVFHKIAGKKMVELVINTAENLNPHEIHVVISDEMAQMAKNLQKNHQNLHFHTQKERLGTAHAVKTAVEELDEISENILVLYGDTPLLEAKTLENMVKTLQNDQNSVCLLAFDDFEENKYGRLVVKNDKLAKIVEFKDATDEEKQITLCNSGVVGIKGSEIKNLLSKINNKNAAGEYYLTDIIKIAKDLGQNCSFLKINKQEVMGVNSKVELAKAERIKQDQLREKFMKNGVTLIDPSTVYFSVDTEIENDVIIEPNVFFGENVKIEKNAHIKAFCHIEGAKISQNVTIGPFARLRPGAELENNSKIGNFVEVKNSQIKNGAKINHLSYIGDSEVGENSNIGAGTITCNYDGYKKSKTKIGQNVFIGSNTALIAPINIGNNAVIGAGSTITKDVKNEDLAVSRSEQKTIKNGGKKYHNSRKIT